MQLVYAFVRAGVPWDAILCVLTRVLTRETMAGFGSHPWAKVPTSGRDRLGADKGCRPFCPGDQSSALLTV